ncbi:MAG: DUF456 domain-containing protein [Mycobacterium leprae]
MEQQHEPTYAPGQEMTLHPTDPGVQMPGAVTQDDPVEAPMHVPAGETQTSPDQVTLIAIFEDMVKAQSCADDLERRGIATALLSRRGDGPEQGTRPGNVVTGPGYGLSAEDQSPPKNAPMGAGVTVGATLGATIGLIASTFVIPPLGLLTATGSLVGTLTGAGIGTFLGGLAEYGAREKGDDATIYAGQVRRGGVILLVRSDPARASQTRQLIDIWDPLEIRVQ